MTDKKISELTSITGADVSDANDVLPIVDTSVATTKKITRAELFKSVSSLTVGDAATNRVGIGTNSPAYKLDVSTSGGAIARFINGSSGGTPSATHGELIVESSEGNMGIQLLGTATSNQKILFGDPGQSSAGAVTYDHTSNYMSFDTNLTERVRIDSNGNVGIGTSNPGVSLEVSKSGATAASVKIVNTTGSANLLLASSNTGFNNILFGDTDSSNTGFFQYSHTTDNMVFRCGGDMVFQTGGVSESLRIDDGGNLLVGGTVTPTSSEGNIVLYNGTAPTGNAANGVILYAEDVSASSELKVRDEAGNVTTLSPHNFDLIPEGPSEDMAWSYYSERDGKRINVDMLKAIRLLEQITGEKLVHMA